MIARIAWLNTWAQHRRLSSPTSLLRAVGRLGIGIARLRHSDPEAGAFCERYVFPTPPLHLSRMIAALELADFEKRRSRASGRTTPGAAPDEGRGPQRPSVYQVLGSSSARSLGLVPE